MCRRILSGGKEPYLGLVEIGRDLLIVSPRATNTIYCCASDLIYLAIKDVAGRGSLGNTRGIFEP